MIKKVTVLGFEPRFPEPQSGVLTTRRHRPCSLVYLTKRLIWTRFDLPYSMLLTLFSSSSSHVIRILLPVVVVEPVMLSLLAPSSLPSSMILESVVIEAYSADCATFFSLISFLLTGNPTSSIAIFSRKFSFPDSLLSSLLINYGLLSTQSSTESSVSPDGLCSINFKAIAFLASSSLSFSSLSGRATKPGSAPAVKK